MRYKILVANILFVTSSYAQTSSITEKVNRTYNADNFVTQEKKDQSDGGYSAVNHQYAKDIMAGLPPLSVCSPSGDAAGLQNLVNRNVIDKPVETYTTLISSSGVSVVTGAEITTYNAIPPYPKALYKIETEVPLGSFVPYYRVGCAVHMDSRYKLQEKYLLYDDYGNLLEKQIKTNKRISYMYNYKGQYLVATVDNASNAQIAYTSFETGTTGFWTYDNAGVNDMGSAGYAGRKAFLLAPGRSLERTSLPNYKYVVSFWQKTAGATPVLSVTGSPGAYAYLFSSQAVPGGWTYYEYRISATTSVKISGGDYIDEVRLHPIDAQMTTAAFIPLVGMQYTCDVSNHLSFYTYDDLGRLLFIKDLNGNIVKKMEYGVKQPE